MSFGKPAASLTASLLARKGQAQPAMGPRSTSVLTAQERAQELAASRENRATSFGKAKPEDRAERPSYDQAESSAGKGSPVDAMTSAIERALAKGREEAARKSESAEAPASDANPTQATAAPAPSEDAAGPIETSYQEPDYQPVPDFDEDQGTGAPVKTRKPKGAGKRVAMTVRLDHDTHLKLKVISAHLNLSSQEIFTAALRTYMEDHRSDVPSPCACIKSQ